ncbi:Fur family transcriptional regulator [Proteiniclasticum ruminis]|uniref:Fur family transcriptional regulator, ferric uptake regulator n=1 Tax=Proteiniclasticum ruminis TaxID=398199 RepID=A0A1G8FWH7_9CLOT|nr:Fur family transcriptional regulator [Proteiniclasticum ruminis]SDH86425.1 Fur family transcriptional regulator, ferric uptake regulator [Proteiniclasticum ruminis]
MTPTCTSEDIQRIINKLKKSGYKLTPQRQAIVDTILDSVGKHLTVEEIFDIVKKKRPEIGLATVYRTVVLMHEENLITRLDLKDGTARYELTREDEHHTHHHLVCIKCSQVLEFMDDLLDPIEEEIGKKYNFKVLDHSLKFYGICNECAKEETFKEETEYDKREG